MVFSWEVGKVYLDVGTVDVDVVVLLGEAGGFRGEGDFPDQRGDRAGAGTQRNDHQPRIRTHQFHASLMISPCITLLTIIGGRSVG
jgi:hypothetical protein